MGEKGNRLTSGDRLQAWALRWSPLLVFLLVTLPLPAYFLFRYFTVTENPGDPDRAKFVQVVQGQGSDRVRALTLLVAETGEWARIRPEVLGITACTYGNGEYTVAVYFANERDARVGERKPLPADLAKALAEVQHLRVREPSYFDLHTPWIALGNA